MRICLAQINPKVGDISGNHALALRAASWASDQQVDLIVFGELTICGYPAADLWLDRNFVEDCWDAVQDLAAQIDVACVIGSPRVQESGIKSYNSAAFICDGRIQQVYDKQHLPSYGVFDEDRWFSPSRKTSPCIFEVSHGGLSTRVGVTICEDAWVSGGPVLQAAQHGAEVVVNLSASPWSEGHPQRREEVISRHADEAGVWIALCNQWGGQDDLVFDGQSFLVDPKGQLVERGRSFEDDYQIVSTSSCVNSTYSRQKIEQPQSEEEVLWKALICGLRDYTNKNGFRSVLLGLSGGIDSALVLALAVDALGAKNVHAVTMPSRFTSEETRIDAKEQAKRLGVEIHELSIEPIVETFEAQLASSFAHKERDVTEENLQARARGTILMAFSNKFGYLLLATGNKSEASVGYATLYGDMNGGFAPIKDLYKTQVYALARWLNIRAGERKEANVIPNSVITRAPSAELAADQTDEASLGSYEVLDAVLRALIDERCTVDKVVEKGVERDYAERIFTLIKSAEYKRRQGPPGIRISDMAHGIDRRMPITSGYSYKQLPSCISDV